MIKSRVSKYIRFLSAFLSCIILILSIPNYALAENGPSSWAVPLVEKAIALNLVPENLRSNYQEPITRAEFCRLIYSIISENNSEIPVNISSPFSDTDDAYVSYAAKCNIVKGSRDGKFLPYQKLTRQEAAVMLTNAAIYLKRDISKDMLFNFNNDMKDSKNFESWAVDSIAWVRRTGIMTGITTDIFSPDGFYTREQSIVTVLRMYDIVIGNKDYRNFKNYVVSFVPQTITNKVFSLQIPENTPYRVDIEQKILEYCEWVQEASGLSFSPSGGETDIVYITNNGGSAYGGSQGINIENMDYILDVPNAEYVYLHELSHTLQFRTAPIDCQPFIEAFAILNSIKVAKDKNLNFLYWHLMSNNYTGVDSLQEKKIISSDFENYYRTNQDGWNNYLYGFRFGVYLQRKYGEDIFTKIIKSYAGKVDITHNSRNDFVNYLKTQTSSSVFTDFVDWYWSNKDIFSPKSSPSFSDKEVYFMPIINEGYQAFIAGDVKIEVSDKVTINFTDSHAYAQFKGYKVNGISGSFSSDSAAIINTYDYNGNLLETIKIEAYKNYKLTLKDAVKFTIKAEKCNVTFNPIFTSCYE